MGNNLFITYLIYITLVKFVHKIDIYNKTKTYERLFFQHNKRGERKHSRPT